MVDNQIHRIFALSGEGKVEGVFSALDAMLAIQAADRVALPGSAATTETSQRDCTRFSGMQTQWV